MESFLKQLTREFRQIMMWDVLKSWQTNLGLYKFSSGADYDTTIYLTAYNGIGTLRNLDSSDFFFCMIIPTF